MSAVPAPATTTPAEASTDIRTPGHLDRCGQPLDELAGLAQRGRLGASRLPIAVCGAGTGHRGDQQGELVAAQPPEHVIAVDQRAQPVGERLEQLVAGGVARACR